MKKLKLKALELGAKEVLTRAQLKNVLGGDEGSGGSVVCVCSDGTEVGTATCANCFTYCNTRGGISCTQGDCTNYPN